MRNPCGERGDDQKHGLQRNWRPGAAGSAEYGQRPGRVQPDVRFPTNPPPASEDCQKLAVGRPSCDGRMVMSASTSSLSIDPASAVLATDEERRRSGRRARARDRLMDRASCSHRAGSDIGQAPERVLPGRDVENLLLFIDDDFRETGMALGRIEAYLVRTLDALEQGADRASVHALAVDREILDQLDVLNETVESFRRRLAKLALRLK